MNRAQAREKFLARKQRTIDLADSLPGLEELDGQLALRELTAAQTTQIDRLSKDANDKSDEGLQMAGLVAKSLIFRADGERIFEDNDIQALSELGLSVLTPIATKVAKLSGLDMKALEDAKKN
jgi:hypothetical protein